MGSVDCVLMNQTIGMISYTCRIYVSFYVNLQLTLKKEFKWILVE